MPLTLVQLEKVRHLFWYSFDFEGTEWNKSYLKTEMLFGMYTCEISGAVCEISYKEFLKRELC